MLLSKAGSNMLRQKPIIEIRDLWWKYEGCKDWILKSISLEAEAGEIISITGPSGAGKTTLCMCLNGLIPHSNIGVMKGTVRVTGIDTKTEATAKLAQKVAMVFQDPESQFIGTCVEDEIVFGAENLRVPRDEIARRLDWALDVVKMKGMREKVPEELSGGQKQRVAIASGLIMFPSILVLDEPTSELDPIGKAEIFALLSDLRKKHQITIVLVEHETEEIVQYADRILLLKDGELRLSGSPQEFFQNVEYVRGLGVPPPQVTEFTHLLYENGILQGELPVTLEACEKAVSEIMLQIPPERMRAGAQVQRRRVAEVPGKLLIQVTDVNFAYPDGTVALKRANLDIHEGEYIGIIGQNGSGKTTLVKHFNGLLKPTKGTVAVDGIDTKQASVAQLSRKVGYVFQNPDHQICQDTVMKEVAFGLRQSGLPEEEVRRRVKDSLGRIGLGYVDLEESPFFLSKGERQRLAVASVLAMKPEVLIVDEPTTGQDYRQRREIMDLITKLNKEGNTTIVISHDMQLIAEYTHRVIVFHEGEIILEGPPEAVFVQSSVLQEAFIRPPQITRLAQELHKYGFPAAILSPQEMYIAFVAVCK